MSFNLEKYLRIWPWLQFVGLELVAGGLIYARFNPVLGTLVASLAGIGSAGVFGYIVSKDGIVSLFGIRRLLQALGYAAMLVGLVLGYTGRAERGALFAFVGTGVAMAGFAYDLLYP